MIIFKLVSKYNGTVIEKPKKDFREKKCVFYFRISKPSPKVLASKLRSKDGSKLELFPHHSDSYLM